MSDLFLSVGEHGTSVDELNLDDGVNFLTRDEGFFIDDAGKLLIPLAIFGANANDTVANRRAVLTKLYQARASSGPHGAVDSVTLGFQHETGVMVYYDIVDGDLVTIQQYPGGTVEEADLILEPLTTPDGATRGTTVTDASIGPFTNFDMPVIRENVPGDRETVRTRLTLTDESAVGAINALRIGVSYDPTADLGDFDSIVDLPAIAPATNVPDVGESVGDAYASREISTADYVDVAGTTIPDGFLNRGRLDLWARVRDNAMAMAAPTGVTADEVFTPGTELPFREQFAAGADVGTTVDATWNDDTIEGNALFAFVQAEIAAGNDPNRRQSPSAIGSSSTASATWGSTTLAGSTLVAIVASESASASAPTNYNPLFIHSAPGSSLQIFIRENAPASSGSVSSSLSASAAWDMILFEIINVAEENVVDVIRAVVYDDGDQNATFVQANNPTTTRTSFALAIASGYNAGTMTNSFINDYNSSRIRVGRKQLQNGPANLQFFTTGTNDDAHVGVVINFKSNKPMLSAVSCSAPAGWSSGGESPNAGPVGGGVGLWFFYWQNAPADSGAVVFTFSDTVDAKVIIAEYANVDPNAAIQSVGARVGDGTSAVAASTGVADQEGVLALAAFVNSGGNAFGSYSGGFVEFADAFGLALAELTTANIQSFSSVAVQSSDAEWSTLTVVIRQELPAENAPLGLPGGSFDLRIRAVDVSGNPGNATATLSDSISEGSSLLIGLTAPSGIVSYYEIFWENGGVVYRVNTPTNAESFLLDDISGAIIVLALPATTGAVPTNNWIRANVGLDGGSLSPLRGKRMTEVGIFHPVFLGTVDAPQVPPQFDGTRPDWRTILQSQSGGGPAADVDIDALWMFRHDGPQLYLNAIDELASPGVWMVEQRPDGRISAWIEDGVGNVVSRVADSGDLALGRGDNVITIMALGPGSEFVLNDPVFSWVLDFFPGYDAQAGSG